MGKHGSDKGNENIQTSWHNYTLVYYNLFKDMKDKKLRIFELGLGTNNTALPSNMGPHGSPGASLRGWAEFFENATVFGADIDRDILFQTDRIKTYYCDQLNAKEIKEMWDNPELSEEFDIIVEDGLHTFDANVCFFENSIHKLKRGGFYIIEDILNSTFIQWSEKLKIWKVAYPELEFQLVQISSNVNKHDNNLMIIRYILEKPTII
jgi:SAM-dependent methyltransferase